MGVSRNERPAGTGRTLLITLGFPPAQGGMQRYLYRHCRQMPDRIAVLAPDRRGAADWDAQQPFPVRRWYSAFQHVPGLRRLWQFGQSYRVAASWLRREHFARLEVGQALPFGAVALRLSRRYDLPYRVFAHGDDLLKPLGWRLWRPLLRLVLRRAEAVYINSHYTARLAVGAGAHWQRLILLRPWIDTDRFRPGDRSAARRRLGLPTDSRILLTVGRIEQRKGVHVVLDALRRLAGDFPDLRYAVVGTGTALPALRCRADALGLAARVIFVGAQAEERLPLWYQAADIFVLYPTPGPGEVEGFGMVYLEAGASGLPVVAGRDGGVYDAVLPGKSGFIVGDEVGLRRALAVLWHDPALRRRFGAAGRQHALALRQQAEEICHRVC